MLEIKPLIIRRETGNLVRSGMDVLSVLNEVNRLAKPAVRII